MFSNAAHLKGDYGMVLVVLIMTYNHLYLVVNQNTLRILNSLILEMRMGTWIPFLVCFGVVIFFSSKLDKFGFVKSNLIAKYYIKGRHMSSGWLPSRVHFFQNPCPPFSR